MKTIDINTAKGQITATIYESAQTNAVLIIASATGVKQSFYKKFAEFISANGITVITFDYLGIGLSLKRPIKELINNAADWGRIDLEAVIQYTQQAYPNSKINLLGHSIGGQLVGLAKSSSAVHKLILVAAQSGYWKLWKGKEKLKMWANWHLLFPPLISLFGYMPSKKISGMEDLPKNVAKQWSSWGKKPNYLFDDIPEQDLFYKNISAKTLAISIENDPYAPQEAVNWLTEKYQNATVTKLHLKAKDFNTDDIGHFGIFRKKFADNLWRLLLDGMEK